MWFINLCVLFLSSLFKFFLQLHLSLHYRPMQHACKSFNASLLNSLIKEQKCQLSTVVHYVWPKCTTVHSSCEFEQHACFFNWSISHDLCASNAMLYQQSYRSAHIYLCLIGAFSTFTSATKQTGRQAAVLIMIHKQCFVALDRLIPLLIVCN